MRRPLSQLVLVVAICVIAFAVTLRHDVGGIVATPDTRPGFVLDPARPFVIEFGRGDALVGMDIVHLDQSGNVELIRVAAGRSETTSLRLSPTVLARVAGLVNENGLTSLGCRYARDPPVSDGTQWVLWVHQGPADKAVDFDNAFPAAVRAFADGLDAVLRTAGRPAATWATAATGPATRRQRSIWDHVR
jgi:hypothetical protein